LLTASKNRVEAAAEWGPSPPADQIFTPEECWALRRGCAHTHNGGNSALRCGHLLGDGPSVCIPLIANGQAVGTLAIQFEAAISDAAHPDSTSNELSWHRQLAGSIAEHLAVAIANLSLREALRVQAVRDPLTGLYNRRYMEEFLGRELQRALRHQRPVALMMLDLDHFKRYNDNFGHAAGDQALAAVGDVLLRCVRNEDVACRYGGEEFTVILSECTLEQALKRAEEIRERVSQCRIRNDQQGCGPITVSIGVAAYDETTDRIELLLKFADEALYEAKRAGRNRVMAARPAVPNDQGRAAKAKSASQSDS
jgi:diguanylate cyclase (GGDEF)-like protein